MWIQMGKNGFSVLIVDDSIIVSDRIIEGLKELDCIRALISALNYEEAVRHLSDLEIDLALIDINMPGKNGMDLLLYIKEHFPSVINIMLTNQSGTYYRNLCNKMGADFFLDKTTEFEKVPDLINMCFRKLNDHPA
jgi:DNA-binding NarL/FixJ family response regulator